MKTLGVFLLGVLVGTLLAILAVVTAPSSTATPIPTIDKATSTVTDAVRTIGFSLKLNVGFIK